MATQTQPLAGANGTRRRAIGIVVTGVTGRMRYRQHLVRSLLAIREQGGLELADGTRLWPEPSLVGRDAQRVRPLAGHHRLERWTTDLDEALAEPDAEIYCDAQVTPARAGALRRAIAAGKHIYTEKRVAESVDEALELAAPPGCATASSRTSSSCPACASCAGSSRAASSAASCPSAASSATGSSKAAGRRRTGRAGTTAPIRAAGSCSTCSATGATCSTT